MSSVRSRLQPFVALIALPAVAFVARAQDPAAKADDLLQQHRERMKVEELKLKVIVNEVVGKTLQPGGDLGEMRELLLNTLTRVRDHPDISAEVRDALVRQLQRQVLQVAVRSKPAVRPVPVGSDPLAPAEQPRFKFKIPAKTPIDKLLPTPPRYPQFAGPLLSDDLAKVPELAFQEPIAKNVKPKDALKQTAHLVAKVNHVNQKKADAYMEALLAQRADLAGLSFVMGDDCRTTGTRSQEFTAAVGTIRIHMFGGGMMPGLEKATQLDTLPAGILLTAGQVGPMGPMV